LYIIKIVERNVTGFKDDTINIQENHEPHSKEVLAYTSLPLERIKEFYQHSSETYLLVYESPKLRFVHAVTYLMCLQWTHTLQAQRLMLVVLIEVTFLTASFVNVIDSSQEKFSP
jgi:hypothetical protein